MWHEVKQAFVEDKKKEVTTESNEETKEVLNHETSKFDTACFARDNEDLMMQKQGKEMYQSPYLSTQKNKVAQLSENNVLE